MWSFPNVIVNLNLTKASIGVSTSKNWFLTDFALWDVLQFFSFEELGADEQ